MRVTWDEVSKNGDFGKNKSQIMKLLINLLRMNIEPVLYQEEN